MSVPQRYRGGMTEAANPDEVVTVHALANGGEGVGRLADGRAVFVPGMLPGETARVELTGFKSRYARATLTELLEASPDRVVPPCSWQQAGCGGCDLMHLRTDAQHRAKVQLAREALQRLGRLADPEVLAGPVLPSEAVRTTVRVAVQHGRAAFRRRAGHQLIEVGDCRVAHPALSALIAEGRFGSAHEAILRVGAGTGERLVVLDHGDGHAHRGSRGDTAGRVGARRDAPRRSTNRAGGVELPDDVLVVDAAELRPGSDGSGTSGGSGGGPAIHEVIAGRRWRISAGSFFQTSAIGAEALVAAVAAAARPPAGSPFARRVLDAYSGVGLLTAAIGPDTSVVSVESNPSSVADARVNLADRDAEVVQARFERWRPVPVDLAVADPARRGLGRAAAEILAATDAAVIVLVSCDLAALGRDSGDLVALGYDHAGSTVLDLFPHTSHAEVVTRFERR